MLILIFCFSAPGVTQKLSKILKQKLRNFKKQNIYLIHYSLFHTYNRFPVEPEDNAGVLWTNVTLEISLSKRL